jgi:sulfoxide reductase heme-binding subunit YedZ
MRWFRRNWLRIAVHLTGLFPISWLVFDYFNNRLTINPIQALELRSGTYALNLLVLTLSATPVYILFGYSPVLKVRRTLGLYTFSYVLLHFLIFTGLDYGFDLELLKGAIFEKKYAIVGMVAGFLLLLLAITSFKYWMAKLGKNWNRLHKIIYLTGLLVIVHYIWVVKTDIRVPLLYGGVIAFLLVIRIPVVRKWIRKFRLSLRSRGLGLEAGKLVVGDK